MQRDLDFIANKYVSFEVPKEKSFLLRYFTTDLQIAFLKYYLLCGRHNNFTDHTGFYVSRSVRFEWAQIIDKFISVYEKAKRELSEESMLLIDKIESGQFILTKLKDC